jgi:hypothetical protein
MKFTKMNISILPEKRVYSVEEFDYWSLIYKNSVHYVYIVILCTLYLYVAFH